MMKKIIFTVKRRNGFSITYAIIGLVVVAVVLAGLTPVLTRKLPNLSTSSIIKNPKGWYESFNAPKEGAKYCKDCFKYDTCLKENEDHPEKCGPKPTPEQWDKFNDTVHKLAGRRTWGTETS